MLAPFHGVKLRRRPSGRRTPIECVFGRWTAAPRLSAGRPSSPPCSSAVATKSCWNIEKGMVLPVSRARISAISLRRRRTISAAFRNSRAFSTGGVSAQAGNALLAALIAILASSGPQSAARA